MRLPKRIWDFFLNDTNIRIYQMWIDSEGAYLDVSDGLKNGKLKHDDEFVEIPDHLLLPCNKNDSPAMGSRPFCYLFSEEGLEWLEPRLTCSSKDKGMKIGMGLEHAIIWWKKHAKALAKLKKVVSEEEARGH